MTPKRQTAAQRRKLMEQQKDHGEAQTGVRSEAVLDATEEDENLIQDPAFPARELTEDEQRDLPRIQALFHGLIKSRCAEGELPVPKRLPLLRHMKVGAKERWFAVPGMYGGFSYRLVARGAELQLLVDSWCRVVDGSGMRHVISATQIILQERGFV